MQHGKSREKALPMQQIRQGLHPRHPANTLARRGKSFAYSALAPPANRIKLISPAFAASAAPLPGDEPTSGAGWGVGVSPTATLVLSWQQESTVPKPLRKEKSFHSEQDLFINSLRHGYAVPLPSKREAFCLRFGKGSLPEGTPGWPLLLTGVSNSPSAGSEAD